MLEVQEKNDCSQPIIGNTVFAPDLYFFCSCFVVQPLQLHCIDMSCVINYSCVFLSLTVKKAVSTVSERLSLPPAARKYEGSTVSLFCLLTRLFTAVHSGVFYSSFFVTHFHILSYTGHFFIWTVDTVYLICKGNTVSQSHCSTDFRPTAS